MKPNPMEPAAVIFMCSLAVLLALSGLAGKWKPGPPADRPHLNAVAWMEKNESGTGRVLVPVAESSDKAEMNLSGATLMAMGMKMDINRASTRDLELLTGIGPFSAGKIVERRNEMGGFVSMDDLRDIPGLGGSAFKSLEKWGRIEVHESL